MDRLTTPLLIAAGLGLGWYLYQQNTNTDSVDQLPSVLEEIQIKTGEIMGNLSSQPVPDTSLADQNRAAFLDMIAYSEGTSGVNGYRTLFGGSLFASFDDHPRMYFDFTNSKGQKLKTSAAGRYQFLIKTWDELARKLSLPDFSPASQDAACLELIRQRGALGDVEAGRVETAINKCAKTWASLPGAGYSQPERKLTSLLTAYQQSGGQIYEATA